MMTQHEPGFETNQPNDASPFLVEFFMVQGINFKCMAYQDDDGRWRRAFYNEELAGRIRIVE